MLSVRCKVCNTELVSTKKPQGCGCSNRMIVQNDTVTAIDLDNVVLNESKDSVKSVDLLTVDDINYQEKRRRRKIRKLTYEER